MYKSDYKYPHSELPSSLETAVKAVNGRFAVLRYNLELILCLQALHLSVEHGREASASALHAPNPPRALHFAAQNCVDTTVASLGTFPGTSRIKGSLRDA